MKTLIAIGKVAALFSSPLLLGLYVYDRSGGNLFAPRLAPATSSPAAETRTSSPDPGGVTVSFSPQPSAGAWDPAVPEPSVKPIVIKSKSAAVDLTTVPQMLLPGSKSFSGATVINAAQLQPQQPPPAQAVQPKPMMLPGSKSLVMPSMIEPAPTPPIVNTPGLPYAPFATPVPTYPSLYPVNNTGNWPNQLNRQPNASNLPQQSVQQAVPR